MYFKLLHYHFAKQNVKSEFARSFYRYYMMFHINSFAVIVGFQRILFVNSSFYFV